jgi:hypothetical protein
LIEEIRARRLGACDQIWYSLAKRATPEEVDELLLSFLASAPDYLDRYHRAVALIQVNRAIYLFAMSDRNPSGIAPR